MIRLTVPRIVVCVAVGVAAVVGVTGCTAFAGQIAERAVAGAASHGPHTSAMLGAPQAGSCWKATFGGQVQDADWFGPKPVSCASAHQLYTFAVLPLVNTYTGSEFTASDYLKVAIHEDAQDTCLAYQDRHYGVSDGVDGRLKLKTFVPQRAQWAKGARWVRCDFNVLQLGSLVDSPKLENLPPFSTLKSQIANDFAVFDFCVDVPGGVTPAGPKVDDATFATCAHPTWTLRKYFSVGSSSLDPYPTSTQFAAIDHQDCTQVFADATHLAVSINPTKENWDDDYTDAQCWVGSKP